MGKSRCLILILLCFYSLFGFSQSRTTDSLLVALKNVKNDVDKAQLLNLIADHYKSTNPKLLSDYASQSLLLSRKIGYKLEEANALLNMGNGAIILGNYTKALKYFADAVSVFDELAAKNNSNDKRGIVNGLVRAYGSIGIVNAEQSNYSKALQYYLKAAKVCEVNGLEEKSARLYNNIGIVYQSQDEDFKALEYFIKCQKVQQKINDDGLGITMTNIGNVYLKQKDYAKSYSYYSDALQHFVNHPDQRGSGELYNNLGLYYKAGGNIDKSIECFKKAVVCFQSIEDKFGIADTYYYLGSIYLEQKQYKIALDNTSKSLALAKELGVLEQIRNAEKNMSSIYEHLERSELALIHYKLYKIASDSISSNEAIRSSVRAEMNFEFDKKEAFRKKEQEKREVIYSESAKRHQQQIGFIVLFVLLTCGIVFLIYNRLQLKKTLTLEKELAEYEQKALHLQMNPHFVFNCLGSISSFIVQNGTDSAIKYLSKFSKLMRLTLEYSKESLIPIDKEIESIQNYLELEQLRLNQKFEFVINKSNAIEDDMALPPLLLQPFVENAIIHGLIPKNADGLITIDFVVEEQYLTCTITDNGIGIRKSQELKENLVSLHKSMALDITKKRLEMMQAFSSKVSNVTIEEIKGLDGVVLGTKVILNLPVQYIQKK